MVDIWKIGCAPGLGTKSKVDKDYYLSFATGKNGKALECFVALGYGFINQHIRHLYENTGSEEAEKIIRNALIEAKKGNKPRRIQEIRDFTLNIEKGNVIVHYYMKKSAYVGEVQESYYFVNHNDIRDYFKDYIREPNKINRAPHRINVEWLKDEDGSAKLYEGVRFSWYDTVHKILPEDLDLVDNKELHDYLERKMKE